MFIILATDKESTHYYKVVDSERRLTGFNCQDFTPYIYFDDADAKDDIRNNLAFRDYELSVMSLKDFVESFD